MIERQGATIHSNDSIRFSFLLMVLSLTLYQTVSCSSLARSIDTTHARFNVEFFADKSLSVKTGILAECERVEVLSMEVNGAGTAVTRVKLADDNVVFVRSEALGQKGKCEAGIDAGKGE